MEIKTALGLLLVLIMGTSCHARAMSKEECKEAVAAASGATEQLRKLAGACNGSGYFELASATDAMSRGDLVDAREWVDAGLKAADFDVMPFYEIEFAINVANKTPEENEQLAEAFVQAHPESAAGYLLLGKYHAASGDLAAAIRSLEKAKALKGEIAIYGANKLFVSAYWDANRLTDAANAFDEAEQAYPQVYNDWSLTQIAAASHFLSGNAVRARSILERQLQLHPESASDKYVRKLATDLAANGQPVKGI